MMIGIGPGKLQLTQSYLSSPMSFKHETLPLVQTSVVINMPLTLSTSHKPSSAPTSPLASASPGSIIFQLEQFDMRSEEFRTALNSILQSNEISAFVSALEVHEAVGFINFLDKALDFLSTRPDLERRCIRLLRKTCGSKQQLPSSYMLSKGLVKTVTSPVANGGFADVYVGSYKNRKVAIKCLRIYSTDDPVETTKTFCKEVIMWKRLSHKNILPFIGVSTSLRELCMVSDWMEHGNIVHYLEAHPGSNRLQLLLDVASGLDYLHSVQVIHGDLKGPNVVIDENHRARLADFGFASIVPSPVSLDPSTTGHGRGTTRWMAPELLDPETPENVEVERNTASDIYAFSMVVIEVFSGNVPFHGCRNEVAVYRMLTGIRPERPASTLELGLTDNVWGLICACWQREPSRRPNAPQVVELFDKALTVFNNSHASTASSSHHKDPYANPATASSATATPPPSAKRRPKAAGNSGPRVRPIPSRTPQVTAPLKPKSPPPPPISYAAIVRGPNQVVQPSSREHSKPLPTPSGNRTQETSSNGGLASDVQKLEYSPPDQREDAPLDTPNSLGLPRENGIQAVKSKKELDSSAPSSEGHGITPQHSTPHRQPSQRKHKPEQSSHPPSSQIPDPKPSSSTTRQQPSQQELQQGVIATEYAGASKSTLNRQSSKRKPARELATHPVDKASEAFNPLTEADPTKPRLHGRASQREAKVELGPPALSSQIPETASSLSQPIRSNSRRKPTSGTEALLSSSQPSAFKPPIPPPDILPSSSSHQKPGAIPVESGLYLHPSKFQSKTDVAASPSSRKTVENSSPDSTPVQWSPNRKLASEQDPLSPPNQTPAVGSSASKSTPQLIQPMQKSDFIISSPASETPGSNHAENTLHHHTSQRKPKPEPGSSTSNPIPEAVSSLSGPSRRTSQRKHAAESEALPATSPDQLPAVSSHNSSPYRQYSQRGSKADLGASASSSNISRLGSEIHNFHPQTQTPRRKSKDELRSPPSSYSNPNPGDPAQPSVPAQEHNNPYGSSPSEKLASASKSSLKLSRRPSGRTRDQPTHNSRAPENSSSVHISREAPLNRDRDVLSADRTAAMPSATSIPLGTIPLQHSLGDRSGHMSKATLNQVPGSTVASHSVPNVQEPHSDPDPESGCCCVVQ